MEQVIPLNITLEQWNKLDSKYGGLFKDIAGKIYNASYDKNDFVQDLKLKTLKILRSFCVKHNLEVDAAIDDPIFDKYLKTGLWNWRATICKNIIIKNKRERSFNVQNNKESFAFQQTVENPQTGKDIKLDFVDTKSHIGLAEVEFDHDRFNLSEIQLQIVELILKDGSCYLKNNSLNYSYICAKLNISFVLLKSQLELLKNKIGNK